MSNEYQRGLNDGLTRSHWRVRNGLSRVTLLLGDDSKPGAQVWQSEGYPTETRDGVQRLGAFGFSSMPLPGASAAVAFQGGYRGFGTILGIEDHRYRPTGLKPGEVHHYMVADAKANGTGGKTRSILKGLLGWIVTLYGKTINIGDVDAVTINVGTTAKSLTLNLGSSSSTVNITGSSGDVKVNGVSLVNHRHSNPDGGNTGPPNQS